MEFRRVLFRSVQRCGVDALGFVVVEVVGDLVLVEPGSGFLHGVAGFDAVEGDHDFLASGKLRSMKSRMRSAAVTHSASGATRAMRTRFWPGLMPLIVRDR